MSAAVSDPFFQLSYAVSRERLLATGHGLASRLGLTVDSRALAERGPEGETLALDFMIFGARRPRHALVISSGTHGVEGHTGSAVQHYLASRILPRLELGPDTAIILQHANNPYGFAWSRRVNEGNVDYNRNFLAHFDHEKVSPDYELLYDLLNPRDLDVAREAQRWEEMQRYVDRTSLRHFQQVALEGQYKYPQGMQFGGHAPQAGAKHLLALVAEHLAQADTVIWLDFHTGLGEFGACELITGAAAGSDSHRFSQQVWNGAVKSAASGESLSTPLNGLLDRGIEAALPAHCRLAFAYPEFGTYPTERVLRAMRADNWLHVHGDPRDATGKAISAELLEALRPDNPRWRRLIIEKGAQLLDQALAHLPGVRRQGAAAPRRPGN